MIRYILSLLLLFVAFCSTCDITATLESQTWHLIYAQITFNNKTVSPVYTFSNDGEQKKVHIQDRSSMMCNNNPTKIEVFKEYPKKGVKPFAKSEAYIDGFGFLNYIIVNDGIWMGARVGVACLAGDCGAARG